MSFAAPAPTLDLVGGPARVRHSIAALASDGEAEWREAQIRLAMAGPRALAALEKSRAAKREARAPRVEALLSLAMLTTVTREDVASHRRLDALVAPQLARGAALAETLAASTTFDMGEVGFAQLLRSNVPATRVQRLLARAKALGGFAVPAALALCRDARPIARAYGILLLSDIQAAIAVERLAALEADTATIVLQGSDASRAATVGETAASARAHLARLRVAPACFEAPLRLVAMPPGHENAAGSLVDEIRRGSAASAATSWDEWWNAARPVWRAWWARVVPGSSEAVERTP